MKENGQVILSNKAKATKTVTLSFGPREDYFNK